LQLIFALLCYLLHVEAEDISPCIFKSQGMVGIGRPIDLKARFEYKIGNILRAIIVDDGFIFA
jgi:hypothetical protein